MAINLTNLVPDHLNHPHVLGRGSSKMVWVIPADPRWVIMNAHPSQVYNEEDSQHVRNRKRREMMYKQRTEFLFTHTIRDYLPLLIPQVREVEPTGFFRDRDRRFRYAKERCELLPLNDDTFPRMIGLLRDMYEHDLVYIDIKPENLGIVRGNLCILDTDPDVFYKVHPDFKEYYINSGFITAVLYSFLHVPEIRKDILRDFVNASLPPATCDAVFAQDLNPYRAQIAASNVDYMTPIIERVRYYQPDATPIAEELARNIQLPMEFIAHYGRNGDIGAREQLELIRNWVPPRA